MADNARLNGFIRACEQGRPAIGASMNIDPQSATEFNYAPYDGVLVEYAAVEMARSIAGLDKS